MPKHSSTDDDGDVWGGDDSDDGNRGHAELDREWQSRHQQFYNGGYREGLDEGKERTLQPGFNGGFVEGAAGGFKWGALRGAVKTLELYAQRAGLTAEQVQELQHAVDVPQREAMLGVFKQLLAQPMPAPQGMEPGSELADAYSTYKEPHDGGSTVPPEGQQQQLPDMPQAQAHVSQQLAAAGFELQLQPGGPAQLQP